MEIVKNSLYSLQQDDTTDMGSLDEVLVSIKYKEPSWKTFCSAFHYWEEQQDKK
jgi:hypothetical protein